MAADLSRKRTVLLRFSQRKEGLDYADIPGGVVRIIQAEKQRNGETEKQMAEHGIIGGNRPFSVSVWFSASPVLYPMPFGKGEAA
jgi:hypothetical protein